MTTLHENEITTAVQRWITESAHALATTDPAGSLTDLEPLQAKLADAQIVGIGESTRAGHEVVSLGHRILRLLVERLGFRVLAIQDDEAAVEHLDAYIRTGEGDPYAALAELWLPWRTREMLAVVQWARSFNKRHPDDPFRVVGLNAPGARPSDYRAVQEHVAQADPSSLDELRRHYDPIITAHELVEHVQAARGIHPGQPFVGHAQEAYALVAALPDSPAKATALHRAQLIVDFHAGSFAGGEFDYAGMRDRSVATMMALHREGARIAYWEGLALTADAARIEPDAFIKPFRSVGNELRRRLGNRYASLLVGFGQGDVGQLHAGQRVPKPIDGSVDAALAAAGPRQYLLDLHAPRPDPVAAWLRGPHQLRTIAGTYDAAADSRHYLSTGRLDKWFDAVLHVRTITSTQLL